MSSPASIGKHPVHPMLIVLPLGLWVFSFVCDLVYLFQGAAIWADVAFYTLAGGLVGALLAAIPGFIDYASIRSAEAGAVARTHMLINLTVVALYAVNLWLRTWDPPVTFLPVLLSAISIVLLGVSGWLGGELVYVHGIGVEPAARPAEEPRDRRAA
jgi:uncharacterized membrane protein